MPKSAWISLIACLLAVFAGCSGTADPAVRTAVEDILKVKGSVILHGATIPIKTSSKLPPGKLSVRVVDLNGLKVRDAQLEALKALKEIEVLRVQDSYLTDAGLVHLQDLKMLQELDLHKSLYITDKGLESIKSLPRLNKLEVSYTRIGDGGIDLLLTMKQLRTLYLTGSRVTPDGLAKLKAGLPACDILK